VLERLLDRDVGGRARAELDAKELAAAEREGARRDTGALVIVLGDPRGDGADVLHERAQHLVDLVLEPTGSAGSGVAHDASAAGKYVVEIIVVGWA
jgi:hypothetical protein